LVSWFLGKSVKLLPPDALIFSSKCTKMRLAAGLCPDPLGELKRSPSLLAAKKGPTSKGRGRERKGEGRKEKKKERERRKRGSGGEGKGEGSGGEGKGRKGPY